MEQDATMENLFDGLVTRSLNAGTLSHAQYDEMTDALAAARDESGRDALMLHLLRVTHQFRGVEITGLVRRAALNGLHGLIIGEETGGRVPILLRKDDVPPIRVLVKVSNMIPATTGGPLMESAQSVFDNVELVSLCAHHLQLSSLRTLAQMNLAARQSAAAAVQRQPQILVVLGTGEHVFRLDVQTECWHPVSPMLARVGVGARAYAVYNLRLYAVGGTRPVRGDPSVRGSLDDECDDPDYPNHFDARVERYCPLDDKWEAIAIMKHSVGEAATAVVDGVLYVTSGKSMHRSSLVQRIDLAAGDSVGCSAATCVKRGWTAFKNAPFCHSQAWLAPTPFHVPFVQQRAYYKLATIGRDLYVIGGVFRGVDPAVDLASVEVFKDGAWSLLAPMPTARRCMHLAVLDGMLYAVGGRQGDDKVFCVERYDPTRNEWEELQSLRFYERQSALRLGLDQFGPDPNVMAGFVPDVGCTLLGVAAAAGGLYAIGTALGNRRVRVDRLDPQTGSWRVLENEHPQWLFEAVAKTKASEASRFPGHPVHPTMVGAVFGWSC